MSDTPIEFGLMSQIEKAAFAEIMEVFDKAPVPREERLDNLHIFLKRQTLTRLLFLAELYEMVAQIPGSIVQCGVRWGGDLVTFNSLRGILEPYNHGRRIIGFDTFTGLTGTGKEDEGSMPVADGQFAVTEGYEGLLRRLLAAHEANAPLQHIRKFDLITGDARQTVPDFLERNRGEAIALLYLDMDIYEPTKKVLEVCLPRMCPGSIIAFDEFSDPRFPGEALAFFQTIGDRAYDIRRSRFCTMTAHVILK